MVPAIEAQYDSHGGPKMIAEVSASEFGEQASDLLSRVQSKRDCVLIRENGKPIAALVDADSYRRVLWQQVQDLTAPIREGFADIPEEIGLGQIDEAVRAVRHP